MSFQATAARIKVTDVFRNTGEIHRLIELNRPEKLNCLSLDMLNSLSAVLHDQAADFLILTGTGRAFCTGLDLDEVKASGGGRHLHELGAVYRCLLTLRRPTLAFVQGFAVGGGAGLMACARTVVVASDFRLRLPAGALTPLAAIVLPLFRLRTGGKTPAGGDWLGCDLSAEECLRLGLADRVVVPDDLRAIALEVRKTGLLAEGLKPRELSPEAVSQALQELDEFLAGVSRD